MRIFKQKPSPAMVVAIMALSVSLVGTAFAGPIAEISGLNKKDKRVVRKISRNISNRVSNRRITQRAPGLAVASANLSNIANAANVANNATNAENAENAENANELDGIDSEGFVARPDLLWALVDGDTGTASIVRGRGATAASSPGTGLYLVTFDRPIAACGIQASLGDATASESVAGEISVDQPSGNSVQIRTYSSAGAPADTLGTNGFYVAVTC